VIIMEEKPVNDEEEHDDVYSEEGREELVEGDGISPAEEGFMEGAHNGGQGAKCRERRKGEDIFRFCSDECSDDYLAEKE
jgi:hypothetical protein